MRSSCYWVAFVLLLACTCPAIELMDEVDIPGSCTADNECRAFLVCSAEGICVEPDVADLPPLKLSGDVLEVCVTITALASFFFILILGFYCMEITFRSPSKWEPRERQVAAGVCMFSVVLCTIVTVAMAFALASISSPLKPPTADSGTTKKPSIAPVTVANITIGVAFVLALVCVGGSYVFTKYNSEYYVSGGYVMTMVSASVCIAVLGVGLPLAAVSMGASQEAPPPPDNLTPCDSLMSPVCAPYYCDVRAGTCYNACTYSEECVSEGYLCDEAGECRKDDHKEDSKEDLREDGYAPRLALWVVVVICVVIVLCCCACTLGLYHAIFELETETDVKTAIYLATFLGVSVAVGVGIPISRLRGAPLPDVNPNGTSCNSDAICAPYFCSFKDVCYDSCLDSSMCVEGYVCKNDACIPSAQSGIYDNVVSPIAATAASLSSAFVLALIASCCCVAGTRAFDEDEEVSDGAFFCCCVVCCCIVALAVGLPLGLVQVDAMPAPEFPPPENASYCVSLEAEVCEPYFCDRRTSRCYEACASDLQCREGTECVFPDGEPPGKDEAPNGVCTALPSTKTDKLFPPWLAFLGTMGGALLVSGICLLMWRCKGLSGTGQTVRMRRRKALVTVLATFFGLLVVLGVVFGVLKNPAPLPGPHATAVYSPAVPSWAVALASFSAVLACAGGVVYVAFPFLPVDWSAPLSLLLTYVADVQIQAAFWLFTSVFCCSLIGVVVVAVPLSTAKVEANPVSLHPSVPDAPAGNNTNATPPVSNITFCVSAVASACFPYYCDTYAGVCNDACVTSADCQEGAVCDGGVCGVVPEVTALPPGWTLFATLSAGAVAFVVTALAGAWLAGASCSLHTMHGSRLHRIPYNVELTRLPAILCTSMCVAGLVLLYVGVPLAYHAAPAPLPAVDGSGEACVAVNAWQCAPYVCDMFVYQCHTECSTDAECKPGYSCAGAQCRQTDHSVLHAATAAVVAALVALALVLFLIPVVRRRCLAFSLERRNKAIEKEAREAQEREELRQRLMRDHPVLLDVKPSTTVFDDVDVVMLPVDEPPLDTLQVSFIEDMVTDDVEVQTEKSEAGNASSSPPSPGDAASQRAEEVTASQRAEEATASQPVDEVPAAPAHQPATATSTVAAVPLKSDDCVVCFCDAATVRLGGSQCEHGLCADCARKTLSASFEANQFPALCPGCRTQDIGNASAAGAVDAAGQRRRAGSLTGRIRADTIERLVSRAILSVEFGRRFIHMQILKAFLPSEVVSCPMCTLLCALPPPKARAASAAGRKKGEDWVKVECPECDTAFCGRCSSLASSHKGFSCDALQARAAGEEGKRTDRLINDTAKRCPKCSMGITHYKGHSCHHIMPGTGCPTCGYHFCIVCLRPHPCNSRDHDMFCDDRCDCPPCPDCRPGTPCSQCDGTDTCPVCVPPL